ncbi:SWIM-type domain-containing protein [Pseudoscourfieldia marina]
MLRTGGEDNKLVEKRVCTWQGNANAKRTIAHVSHVDYPSKYTVVNINDATCSCGRGEVVGGPFCVCLATAANSAGVDLASKLDVRDTTERWRKQCEAAYSTISSIKMPCTADLDYVAVTALQPPAAAPRPKGRPPKPDRKKSSLELALGRNKCAVCGQNGHKPGSKKCAKFRRLEDTSANAAPWP